MTDRHNVTVTSLRPVEHPPTNGGRAVPKKLREVVWRGQTFMVDEHGVVQHDVDMVAYDTEMEAAGFEFVDDPDEEGGVELTFLVATGSDPPEDV